MDFSPQVGREQMGVRPGLVISHDRFNALENDRHIAVPLTRSDRGYAYHVRVDPRKVV